MRTIFLIAFTFIYQSCYSQECSKELLASKPGTWKPGIQGSIQNVTATDLAKEKGILFNIHNKVKMAYSPTGCEVKYSYVFGKNLSAGQNWKADPFHYTMYLLRYLCDPHDPSHTKYYVDISTATTVTIAVNVAYWLNTLWAADLAADESRGYYKLEKRPEIIDGFLYMGDLPANSNRVVREHCWLITYHLDSLPFRYVSRKEYLEIQRKRLLQDMMDSPGEIKYFEGFIRTIDQYLANASTSELLEPASAMWNQEERFEGFVPEGTKGSFLAIKPNLSYYRKNLPRSSPQFFSVVYKFSNDEPVFLKNIEDLKKAVDFKALQTMLGK